MTLAAEVMGYLTPYILHAGKEVAGGALKEVGKGIPATLMALLRPDIENTRCMKILEENPSSEKGLAALQSEIDCLLEEKPELASQITEIINSAPHQTAITQHGAGSQAAGTVHGGMHIHHHTAEKKKI